MSTKYVLSLFCEINTFHLLWVKSSHFASSFVIWTLYRRPMIINLRKHEPAPAPGKYDWGPRYVLGGGGPIRITLHQPQPWP